MSKVILISSGKGGTGKTMFAANLGATLAQKGKKVVIVDMDMGLRNLDLYMGLENNVVYDAYDVMTGVCRIKQALIRDKRFDQLYIMASAPKKDDGTLTPLHMQVLSEKLKNQFDFIIVDGPSGMEDGLVIASGGADEAIIVTTPEYSSLRDADAMDRALMTLGIKNRYFVLNKVIAELISSGYAPSIQEINSMLRPELIGIIQYDENIHISTNLGTPIILKDGTYIKENFDKIADRLI
ncbi:MAG: septum site-determining protein MinD [Eubacteriales bacterium]|nr:septum site-determining protein MinD [Eubacteriales bacterium]